MIISKTPIRISLSGGGTDFRDYYRQSPGKVISCAINKYIYVLVKERFDDLIVLNYTQHEIVESLDAVKHELIKECMKKTGIEKAVEISTLADIPSRGSGLGSSSAVTVGLLNALYNYQGIIVTQERLAREACEIEIEILGRPIGKQDQYIAAYGGLKKFTFNSDESVEVYDLGFNLEEQTLLGINLFLHFTNLTRDANPILAEQKNNIHVKKTNLDKLVEWTGLLEAKLADRKLSFVGEVLKETWMLKKQLAGQISTCEIDSMVDLAMTNGAAGCKIAGAGGGGFLLSYADSANHGAFRQAMSPFRELHFAIEPFGSRIIFNIQ